MPHVKVQYDLCGVREKLQGNMRERGKYMLLNQMHADMNRFVPMKKGTLRQTAAPNPDLSVITWIQRYASRQFYTQHRNYSTPGTGSRWDEAAKRMYMESWIHAFLTGSGLT